MAADHFRFVPQHMSQFCFTPFSHTVTLPQVQLPFIVHFSDCTLFSQHILALCTTALKQDYLPCDSPCQLSNILDTQAVSSPSLDLSSRFTDDQFRLPQGFLQSHPTVQTVTRCDTKLLPPVPLSPGPYLSQFTPPFTRPEPTIALKLTAPDDYHLYQQVIKFGCPNYRGARVDIIPGFPYHLWERLLDNYHDQQVVTFMRFGWPTSYMGHALPTCNVPNHTSSLKQWILLSPRSFG